MHSLLFSASLTFSLIVAIIIIINVLTGEKVEIFNQVAETLKVRDLATLIAGKTGVEIRNLENPRKEDAENELQVRVARSYQLTLTLKMTVRRPD